MTGILKVDQIQNIEDASSVKVNRTTSDGAILDIQKDGTSVGSINSLSFGDMTIGSGDVRLRFDDTNDRVVPRNASDSGRDNAIDLGGNGIRFKDCYLGGALYVGGTQAANALDDYEVGSFTPNYSTESGGESITYDGVTAGSYIKIGSLVFITGFIRTDSVSGGGSYLYLGGFPFTNASGNSRQGFIGIARSSAFVTHQPSALEMVSGGTKAFVKFRGTSDGNSDNLLAGNLGTGANANIILFSGAYTTS